MSWLLAERKKSEESLLRAFLPKKIEDFLGSKKQSFLRKRNLGKKEIKKKPWEEDEERKNLRAIKVKTKERQSKNKRYLNRAFFKLFRKDLGENKKRNLGKEEINLKKT